MGTRVNRKGVVRREALIDAAIELWATSGSRGTGITAVAERAGITPSGLLHHFGTKERFLLAVIVRLDQIELERHEAMGPVAGLDLFRRLPDMVRNYVDHPEVWKLHHTLQAENLDPGSPAYRYYVVRHEYLRDLWIGVLRAGQDGGEIRPDVDPTVIAVEVLAFLQGMVLHTIHGPGDVDPVTAATDYAERMIRDLAVDPD
jgi:AcrR family transcriptional regulator